MKSGALARTPSRRSCTTCPISWTSRSSTKPIANCQPQISEYAAIDTSIEPEVVRILSFGRISSSAFSFTPSFAMSTPSAASALPSRFQRDRRSVGSGA